MCQSIWGKLKAAQGHPCPNAVTLPQRSALTIAPPLMPCAQAGENFMGSRFSRSACMALALVAMILLPACQSAPASKPDALTYADTKNLPPETLKKRVLAQLGAIVSPAPPPPHWRPFERSDTVNDTWLATRPRLAEGGGFCTYDRIQVMLSPDNQDEDRTRNTPMHAIGVATTSWFSPVAANAKDCTSYDPATAHYFETEEPMSAGQDFSMLKDVLARMRSPTPGFAIDCTDIIRCGDLPDHVGHRTPLSARRWGPVPAFQLARSSVHRVGHHLRQAEAGPSHRAPPC